MLHEWGYPSDDCGVWKDLGNVRDMQQCAVSARGHGYGAFSITHPGHRENHCYGEAIDITEETWAGWQANRFDSACPNGYWISNPDYNTWAINPSIILGAVTMAP